jgi:multicomponent Na+:H+ antiporter subunit D
VAPRAAHRAVPLLAGPAPVCVLFSGLTAPLGVYGVARVYWTVFHGLLPDEAVKRTMLVIAVLTTVLAALMCVTQRHIKRLLAYPTIAHIALFLLGFAALSALGIAGAGVYLVGHAAVKGAFLLTGLLLSRYESVDELSLYGRARSHPIAGGAFVPGALALAACHRSGTGLGKSLVDDAGASMPLTVAVSALTGGAALRVGLRVYFGLGHEPHPESTAEEEVTGRDEQPDARPPQLAGGPAVGVVPRVRQGRVGRTAAAFVGQHGYVTQALAMTNVPSPAPPPTDSTTTGVVTGLVATALAIALLGLYGTTPGWLRRPVRPALHDLHQLHSGHLGDYAAWLVLGSAALAGLLIV